MLLVLLWTRRTYQWLIPLWHSTNLILLNLSMVNFCCIAQHFIFLVLCFSCTLDQGFFHILGFVCHFMNWVMNLHQEFWIWVLGFRFKSNLGFQVQRSLGFDEMWVKKQGIDVTKGVYAMKLNLRETPRPVYLIRVSVREQEKIEGKGVILSSLELFWTH